MKSFLTKTQKMALKTLIEHGGEGAIMKNGCVLARGVILGEEPDTPGLHFSRSTWKHLKDHGLLESAGAGRLKVSLKGMDYTW